MIASDLLNANHRVFCFVRLGGTLQWMVVPLAISARISNLVPSRNAGITSAMNPWQHDKWPEIMGVVKNVWRTQAPNPCV